MKRLEISILLAVIFCAAVSLLAFDRECEDIRGSVLRLHVLANSDSEEDQQLKLRVRDRVLEESADMFGGAADLGAATRAAQDGLQRLQMAAQQEVYANGYDYPVEIKLEKSYFNTRTYGGVTLPAGDYLAVRVLIGAGAGKNWWCVMFPPLCISAAGGTQIEDVLSDGDLDIVSGDGYEIRFKCIEWLRELISR